MAHKLKLLSLALVAVFAMGAMVTSVASAASFTSSSSTTTIRGEDDSKVELFVTGVGFICTEVTYHAHVTNTSFPSIKVDPSYKGCKNSIGTEARFTGFGDFGEPASAQCEFVFYANATVDLECPVGVEVTVDSSPCTIYIPTQTNIGTNTYTTGVRASGKHDLTLDVDLTNITTNHTDPFLCPLPIGGHGTDARLIGQITLWGQDPVTGKDVDLTWNP